MKRFLILFLLLSIGAFAQVAPQITGAGAPANPCFNGGQEYVDTTNHVLYSCPANGANWVNRGLGNISGNMTSSGAITAGHCASWVDYRTLQDSGGSCGGSGVTGPGSSTTNAVTLFTDTTGQVLKDSTQFMVPYATDTGSANAIAINVPGLPAALTLGTCVRFKAAASSTGATTITITPTGQSAYAATNLMKRTTAGVANFGATGDLITGGLYEACYDGTQFVLMTTQSTVYTGGALTSNGIIRGNAANQVAGTSTLTTDGDLFTKIHNEALVGVGTAYVRGQTLQKAETQAADSNVLTVTPASTVGTYRACVAISVASATSGVISWTLSWTDSNGNAQSNIAQPLFQLGTAAPNTTFTTSAAGNYTGCNVFDVNNAGASIVVKWVGGGTSSAKMTAIIERLGL